MYIFVTVVGSLVYDQSCIYLLQWLGHWCMISRDIHVTVVGSLVYDLSYCTLCIYLYHVYLLQWLGHWYMICRVYICYSGWVTGI